MPFLALIPPLQLYTALNMPLIDRLKRTWALVPKADKDILKKVPFSIYVKI